MQQKSIRGVTPPGIFSRWEALFKGIGSNTLLRLSALLLLLMPRTIFAAVANPFGDVTSLVTFMVGAFIVAIAGIGLIVLAYKGITAFMSGRIVEGVFEVLGICFGLFLAYSSRGWINSEFGTNF